MKFRIHFEGLYWSQEAKKFLDSQDPKVSEYDSEEEAGEAAQEKIPQLGPNDNWDIEDLTFSPNTLRTLAASNIEDVMEYIKDVMEYIKESDHQGWDGFSETEVETISKFLEDMALYIKECSK